MLKLLLLGHKMQSLTPQLQQLTLMLKIRQLKGQNSQQQRQSQNRIPLPLLLLKLSTTPKTDMDTTTPKIEVDAEDADGEGRTMLEESSTTTTLPDDEIATTPRSESESTVPPVSQEGSTETPETEVTALPNIDADEDAEMTTLSQSPPSLGPSNEGSGAPDAQVTSSPVDAEDGPVTTIIPDAV